MKRKIFVLCFLILYVFSSYAQDKPSAQSLIYIPIQNFNNIPTVNITEITDFSKIITDYSVKHIFYTSNTFFFQASQMAYPFQYSTRDSVFFYACKFAQYLDYNDFQTNYNNKNSYTIKGSDTVAMKNLKKTDYDTFLNELNTLLRERQNSRNRY